MNELISIIIPVYNVEQYLEACIESVIKQSYSNIEIILIDDGSTDSSGAMCDALKLKDSRIRVLHKKNGGLSDARNFGIENAEGDFMVFVDSDDIVSDNFVEYLYALVKDTETDIGICDPIHCYPGENTDFVKETNRSIFKSEDAIAEMLYQKSFLVAAWGKIYKRKFFQNIRFPFGMLFEDSAIMYKVFEQAESIVYGDAKLYGYMHREGSITTKKFSKRDCDILKIVSEISKYMEGRSDILTNAARAYHASAALRIYMNAPRNGEFDVEISLCNAFLRDNLKALLSDRNIRMKLRLALLLFKYARPIMPVVYKRVNRWK